MFISKIVSKAFLQTPFTSHAFKSLQNKNSFNNHFVNQDASVNAKSGFYFCTKR
jgi:hypothetical protein